MECIKCHRPLSSRNRSGYCYLCAPKVQKRGDSRETTIARILNKAQALEKRVVDSSINEGQTFIVESDHSPNFPYPSKGKIVSLRWGKLVESHHYLYDDDGCAEESIMQVPEHSGYLIPHQVVRYLDGNLKYKQVLPPAPLPQIKKFIAEAQRILGEK